MVVAVEDGGRMITNVLGIEGAEGLAIDAQLVLETGSQGGVPVAGFHLADRIAGADDDVVWPSERAGWKP